LGVVLRAHISTSFNYRQFSGIAALAERVFAVDFGGGGGGANGDNEKRRKSELEVADFDRLFSRLESQGIEQGHKMRNLLAAVRESG